MRLTLEQIKAMSDVELGDYWADSKFPFDQPTSCMYCLTDHVINRAIADCHPELTQLSFAICDWLTPMTGEALRPYLEQLYALRLYFDSLYPPVPAAEPVVINQAVAEPVRT